MKGVQGDVPAVPPRDIPCSLAAAASLKGGLSQEIGKTSDEDVLLKQSKNTAGKPLRQRANRYWFKEDLLQLQMKSVVHSILMGRLEATITTRLH